MVPETQSRTGNGQQTEFSPESNDDEDGDQLPDIGVLRVKEQEGSTASLELWGAEIEDNQGDGGPTPAFRESSLLEDNTEPSRSSDEVEQEKLVHDVPEDQLTLDGRKARTITDTVERICRRNEEA